MGKDNPPGMSPLHQHGHEVVVQERWQERRPELGSSSHNEDHEILEDVVEDLEYMTTDIDAPHLDDFPQQM